MVVAGLLLAAGAGRRMGLPKGLVRDADGTPWVARSVQALAAGGCHPVVVVVGARADEVAALVPPSAVTVTAVGWAEGMGASLRSGLDVLAGRAGPEVVAVIVGLVDTPGVTPAVVVRLTARAADRGPSGLARAAYDGVPGHPVVLGRDHWTAVAGEARGDAGARAYLSTRAVDLVECSDVGDGRDVDRPAP